LLKRSPCTPPKNGGAPSLALGSAPEVTSLRVFPPERIVTDSRRASKRVIENKALANLGVLAFDQPPTASKAAMPLIGISIKLAKVNEGLLYKDAGGGYWLSGVCTLDLDERGRTIIAQSMPKERFAAGEKGPRSAPGGKSGPPGRPLTAATAGSGYCGPRERPMPAKQTIPGAGSGSSLAQKERRRPYELAKQQRRA